METQQVVREAGTFFEAYFALCADYTRRHRLLERETRGRNDEKEGAAAAELQRSLLAREAAFWQEYGDSEGGQRFAAYAAHFGLDRFAQRVVLYLLYHEIANGDRLEMSPRQLAELFADSARLVDRIALVRRFARDGMLVQRGILRRDEECDMRPARIASRSDMTLRSQHSSILTQLAAGETVHFAELPAAVTLEQELTGGTADRVGSVLQPATTFDDVVLTPVARERLELFLGQFRDRTLEKFGVAQHIRHSTGLTLLFYGPPGTGKSMLAEAVGSYLGRDVLQVEIPKIINRWVGETDKQIDRAFAAAKASNAVLLFDEADSLLLRRDSLAQDFEIRFVNDMLAALEKHDGVVVLTTNMDTLLDPAVERRLDMKLRFEPPPAELRAAIWRKTVPPSVAAADDIDYLRLAREYVYSGGYIRNAVLTALRHMAGDRREVLTMADMLFGAEFERDGLFVKENRAVQVAGFTAQC